MKERWIVLFVIAGALHAAETPTPTILFLGDSLTAGYGLSEEQAHPAVVAEKLSAAGVSYQVINAGVSGETTAGGLRRLGWLLQRKVDILIVSLGGNDGLRGVDPASTEQNLQAIIDKAKANQPDIRIILTGMRMPPSMGAEYTTAFRELFPRLAVTNGLRFVPFLLEGVGGISEMNLPDGIHPNAAGQRRVAENVYAVLVEMIGLDVDELED